MMFAVSFMTLALLLLLLNPFNMQEPLGIFIWPFFSGFDVALNILLFLPMGVALRQSKQFTHWQALIYAALLSTLAEIAQLYLPARYSGLMDILSNVLGTSLGFMLWSTVARHRLQTTPILLIALLTPLGWIAAMRSILSISSAWVFSLELLMAAALFKQACSARRCLAPHHGLRSAYRKIQHPITYAIIKRYFHAYYPVLLWSVWLVAFLSGLLVINRKLLLLLLLVGFSLPWWLIYMTASARTIGNVIGGLLLSILIMQNLVWFTGVPPHSWAVLRNLHWIEVLLFGLWWGYCRWEMKSCRAK